MADYVSPRVNQRRLSDYIGQLVRLPSRVIKISDGTALVEACDGGEVEVKLSPGQALGGDYVEIIGRVDSGNSLKFFQCIVLGNKLDMRVLNDAIELSHHEDFKDMFQPV